MVFRAGRMHIVTAAAVCLLGGALRRPLIDGTGLDGWWTFDVRWTFPWRDDPSAVSPEAAIERTIPTRKVVVTAVSRPSEN